MSDDADVAVERLPPDEAFELLAHETRFAILETLNDAGGGPLAFSDLRKRVGVRDAGRFNYHLGKLVGRFVRRADSGGGNASDSEDGGTDADGDATDGGYELTAAGRRVVGAVLSGSYSKRFDADALTTDAPCLECGDPMELRFREGGVKVTCPDCGDYTDFDMPPGVFEGWPRAELPSVVARWLDRMHWTAETGFCPTCDGRIDRTVHASADDGVPVWVRDSDFEAVVAYECDRCGDGWTTVVPIAVLTHPALVAFHYEHGVDVRRTPPWDLDWLRPGLAVVVGVRPLRVEVPVALDGETRRFVFDENLGLVEEH
ncbi:MULTISPECIES: DUF7351 domain-containing protein [Halorussus]|uniref:DUF7351 domain-containing protein n=1 Tax=Halorussus TaxID=1070314 RepID=UPI0020A20532|nr:helix-turn-helix domain-containing protein [Halorussus vallis]USZ76262.1 helix-turn-helix domain-containing protein [Halorussus vallis]